MSEDRRTKAQLLEDLAAVRAEHHAALERQREIETKLRTFMPQNPVPEADALGLCITALDRLKDSERRSSSLSYGESHGAVKRTILALCEKYGVPRVERVTEPCSRRHLEDLTSADVVAAVRQDLERTDFGS